MYTAKYKGLDHYAQFNKLFRFYSLQMVLSLSSHYSLHYENVIWMFFSLDAS